MLGKNGKAFLASLILLVALFLTYILLIDQIDNRCVYMENELSVDDEVNIETPDGGSPFNPGVRAADSNKVIPAEGAVYRYSKLKDFDFIERHRTFSFHKWIVVTSVNSPTEQVQELCKLAEWVVLIVGDKKTPENYQDQVSNSADGGTGGCIFFSVAAQAAAGYKVHDFIPYGKYERIINGYLFAISHGAEIIWDTDDDNVPLGSDVAVLNEHVCTSRLAPDVVSWNVYAHFGYNNVWPRGLPLDMIHQDVPLRYAENTRIFAPVQQGLANLDPDVDAIYRLTQHHTIGNIIFDENATPLSLPEGTFSPFNSQNTVWYSSAFWGLLLPVTTRWREDDIWRSYWVQRLLWEIGAELVFVGATVEQVRNSHSYYWDFQEELNIYSGKVKKLIEFLLEWKPPTVDTGQKDKMFVYMQALISDLVVEKQLHEQDLLLMNAWIEDLKALGYHPPKVRAENEWGGMLVETGCEPQQIRNFVNISERSITYQLMEEQNDNVDLELSTNYGIRSVRRVSTMNIEKKLLMESMEAGYKESFSHTEKCSELQPQLSFTSDDLVLSWERNKQEKKRRDVIGFVVPILSYKPKDWDSIDVQIPTEESELQKHLFYTTFLPSLVNMVDSEDDEYDYEIYVGVDDGDPLYDRDDTYFATARRLELLTANHKANFRLNPPVVLERTFGNTCFIWNTLAAEAIHNGADYVMEAADDTLFIAYQGFFSHLVERIKRKKTIGAYEIENFGVSCTRDVLTAGTNWMSCHSAMYSAEIIAKMGWMHPPEIANFGAEHFKIEPFAQLDNTGELEDIILGPSIFPHKSQLQTMSYNTDSKGKRYVAGCSRREEALKNGKLEHMKQVLVEIILARGEKSLRKGDVIFSLPRHKELIYTNYSKPIPPSILS